jgi:hypothetical protein
LIKKNEPTSLASTLRDVGWQGNIGLWLDRQSFTPAQVDATDKWLAVTIGKRRDKNAPSDFGGTEVNSGRIGAQVQSHQNPFGTLLPNEQQELCARLLGFWRGGTC